MCHKGADCPRKATCRFQHPQEEIKVAPGSHVSPVPHLSPQYNGTQKKVDSLTSFSVLSIPCAEYSGEFALHDGAWAPATTGYPPLGAAWQFPSDHLPVGSLLEDGLRVVSWNVMDSRYTKLVENQGLVGSMLTVQDVKTGVGTLTWRDATVLHTLLSWMTPHPQPVAVIALQECSQDFLAVLDVKLRYGPFKRADTADRGDAVLLYHAGILDLHSTCLLYTSPSPRDRQKSRMPSSA